MSNLFVQYYQDNFWGDDESVSGSGSNMASTEEIRKKLPQLLHTLGITSLLDIPCGDWNWMSKTKLSVDHIIGADVVPEMIEKLNAQYAADPRVEFRVINITVDLLPKVDMILCRDMLGHFSNRDVQTALRHIKASGAKYLLATTFPTQENIADIVTGQWRPINLARYFGLPDPALTIPELCPIPGFEDKALGLWVL